MSLAPLVTVGLPLYNSERYVKQSLDSLLGQTYRDFVLIISDNASTDSTPVICQQYAAADSRVQYVRNTTNIGNPRNFNRVAELASTRYLKWSTGDDFWDRTFLERAVEVMERDASVGLCYPKTYLVEADGGNPTPYEDGLHLVQADPVERFLTLLGTIKLAHQHLGLIRMSFLRQTHMLRLHVGSDLNLLGELALYGKFHELPERLFFRRLHPTSGSWNRNDAGHQAKYYHGAGARSGQLTLWRIHLGHFSSVRGAPLPMWSKLKAYRRLLRRMIWDRRELLRELRHRAGV